MRASKTCSHPRCPNLQPCEDHPKVAWQGSTRRTELPSDWERRRRTVLERDEICTDGRVCRGLALATECHHTGSKHDHRVESLAGVCKACHAAATQEQAAEARCAR
jgi:hypothetical protein